MNFNFSKEAGGLSEEEFNEVQENLRKRTERDLLAREENEEHKGGTYYVMFPKGESAQRQAIDFINNEYARIYPVKAARDPERPEEGVSIEFNNDARRNMETLLRILSERGLQKTEEQIYFNEKSYEPAPSTGPAETTPVKEHQFEVYEGGKKPPQFQNPEAKKAA